MRHPALAALVLLALPGLFLAAEAGSKPQKGPPARWGREVRKYRLTEKTASRLEYDLQWKDAELPWAGRETPVNPRAVLYRFGDRRVLIVAAGAAVGPLRLELTYSWLEAKERELPQLARMILVSPRGKLCPEWQDFRLTSIELEDRGCGVQRIKHIHGKTGDSVFRAGDIPRIPGDNVRVLSDGWVVFPQPLSRTHFQVNLTGVSLGDTRREPPPETLPDPEGVGKNPASP